MSARIVVNIPKFKGEYPFDIDSEPFTALEWRWVKKIAGYMPMTIDEGWRGGDPDLFVALAVVALARAGRIRDDEVLSAADVLLRAPFDGTAITILGDEQEETEDPPAAAVEIEQPLRSIGGSSPQTLESQVFDLRNTGAHG